MVKKLMIAAVVAGVMMVSAGCKSCTSCGEAPKTTCGGCDGRQLVFEDGTPAPCCRTVTKFSH